MRLFRVRMRQLTHRAQVKDSKRRSNSGGWIHTAPSPSLRCGKNFPHRGDGYAHPPPPRAPPSTDGAAVQERTFRWDASGTCAVWRPLWMHQLRPRPRRLHPLQSWWPPPSERVALAVVPSTPLPGGRGSTAPRALAHTAQGDAPPPPPSEQATSGGSSTSHAIAHCYRRSAYLHTVRRGGCSRAKRPYFWRGESKKTPLNTI